MIAESPEFKEMLKANLEDMLRKREIRLIKSRKINPSFEQYFRKEEKSKDKFMTKNGNLTLSALNKWP